MSWQETDPFTLLREQTKLNGWEPDPEQYDRWMEEMGNKLFFSSLATSYRTRAMLGDAASHVQTPADVIGERDFRVGLFLLAADEDFDAHSDPRIARLPIAVRAMTAAPYLWTSRCFEVARSTDIPRHVISRTILPYPRLWWTLETAYTFHMILEEGAESQPVSIDAWLISDEGTEGFTVSFFGQTHDDDPEDAQMFVMSQGVPYGKTYPDDFAEGGEREGLAMMLSMLAFLNSPYIPKQARRPNRAERRLFHAVHGPDVDDLVRFIDLRVPEPKDQEPTGEHGEVDWKHRWVVRGHNRAQWYPSEMAHHLIYIAPYLKGPEDAPLLEHAYRVKR